MAEGFLKSFDDKLEVYSAGTKPSGFVHPNAVKVMSELGINISKYISKNLDSFLEYEWDYVITVCDNAKETCPVFTGNVVNKIHIGFEDPADAEGSEEHVLNEFRKIRDEIKEKIKQFYVNVKFKSE
jgi:arsenate reductase